VAQRKIKIRGVYRSGSHLPVWGVLQEAGIWEKVGLDLVSFDYCAMPPDAEAALFKGDIDFISGDHLTPYGLVAQGKPIVSIASPVNGQNASVASREIHDARQGRAIPPVYRHKTIRRCGGSNPVSLCELLLNPELLFPFYTADCKGRRAFGLSRPVASPSLPSTRPPRAEIPR
jgi:ABC-type nitrate/sulfonate/bicarbonate transport system substrate-binding protein